MHPVWSLSQFSLLWNPGDPVGPALGPERCHLRHKRAVCLQPEPVAVFSVLVGQGALSWGAVAQRRPLGNSCFPGGCPLSSSLGTPQ